jgi:DNA-binding response OmpR family regulator
MESIPLQTRGVLRRIRKIPIIGMSANSDDVSREMALTVGMDSFVCKPFNWNDLQPLLHRYGIARTETSSSNISSRSNSLSVLGSRIASRVQSRRGSNNNLELLEHAATKVIAYNESMAAVPQSQSDGSTHAHHLNGSTAIENHYSRSGGGNGGTVSPIIEELNTGEPSSEEEYS